MHRYPSLKESRIIRNFATTWPKNSYNQNKKSVSGSYNSAGQAIGRSVSIVILYLVCSLIRIPPALQDMAIEVMSTATIGYTAIIHLQVRYKSVFFYLKYVGYFCSSMIGVRFALRSLL